MDSGERLVELGFCTRPHGIKGGFTFILSNTEDSIIQTNSKLFLFPKDNSSSLAQEGEVFEVDQISFGNKVIAYLKGVADRNQVEAMIPFFIKMDRDDFPVLGDDEFYLSDLVGIEVIDDKTGEKLGSVDSFYENGAQVVLILLINNRKVELPFVDHFFPSVDMDNGLLRVILPEEI